MSKIRIIIIVIILIALGSFGLAIHAQALSPYVPPPTLTEIVADNFFNVTLPFIFLPALLLLIVIIGFVVANSVGRKLSLLLKFLSIVVALCSIVFLYGLYFNKL